MKKLTWFLASLILVILVACDTSQPGGGSNNNSGGGDVTGGGSGDIEEDAGSVEVSIPSINEPAPSGVLEQLSWAGAGGEGDNISCFEGECWLDWQDGDVLILREFEPNQRLALLFYRTTGENACGFLGADYTTGYYVDVDSSGSREVHISGLFDDGFYWDPGVVFLYQVLDAETWEPLWQLNLGKQFVC